VGDVLLLACPNAVGGLLVFLHLLEGEVERIAQLLLTHCKHHVRFFDIRDHAALALPETLRRARRVALSVPAVIEPS